MTQTRLSSLVEALLNTAIGFVLSVVTSMIVFPLYGMPLSFSTNLHITFWFTLVSIARGYVVRRWFNARLHRLAQRLAGQA